jgi:hypothetical protein
MQGHIDVSDKINASYEGLPYQFLLAPVGILLVSSYQIFQSFNVLTVK